MKNINRFYVFQMIYNLFAITQTSDNQTETTNDTTAGETEPPKNGKKDIHIEFVETPNQDQEFKEISIDYKDLRQYDEIKKDEQAGPSVTSPDINDMVNLVFDVSNVSNWS